MEAKSKSGTKIHEKNVRAARKVHEFRRNFCEVQAMLEKSSRYDTTTCEL